MDKVNLAGRLARFEAHRQPHVVTGHNGDDFMVVKVQGAFSWHAHPETDDPSLFLSGRLAVDLPDGSVELEPGDFVVLPQARATGRGRRPRQTASSSSLRGHPTAAIRRPQFPSRTSE